MRVRTRIRKTIQPVQPLKKGLKIMMVRGINLYGKLEVIIIDENCTVYGELCRNKILPIDECDRQQYNIMQNRARCHTAKVSRNNTSQRFGRIGQATKPIVIPSQIYGQYLRK